MSEPSLPGVSIVMAAYNEEDALPECAQRVLDFLEQRCPDGELLIVDDGSSDDTPRLVDELAETHDRVRAFHLEQNSGMGAALRRGFEAAQKPWVTIMPADGQIDPFEIQDFFAVAEDADLVTSLYRNRRYSLGRKVLSVGLRGLTASIVGTRARTEGIYLVRREVLEKLAPKSSSFLLNLEVPIRAKRAGYRVKTIHMNVHPRSAGHSKATNAKRAPGTTFARLKTPKPGAYRPYEARLP